MDPPGSSSPWWAGDSPSYSDQQASPPSQSSSGDVPYPMPVQVQMSYNHTSRDPARIQPVSEGPPQILQGRQQPPPSRSSLVNRVLNITMETPEGSCSWTTAEAPSYPDQQAAHSTQWVNGDVHQRMVQPPGCSPYSMPVHANNIQQPPNELREDTESGTIHLDDGAYFYQNSSGSYQLMLGEVPWELVAVGQENLSHPLIDGNNPDKTSSSDVDLPDADSPEYVELGVKQADPEAFQSDQHFVQRLQPIDFNGGQNLNEPILYHRVFSQQLVANRPPLGQIDLPNPPNSLVQVQQQYAHTIRQRQQQPPSNEKPIDHNPVRKAVRPRPLKNTPHQCPTCKEFFASASGLTQHQVSIHTVRPFRCPKCGKRFASQAILDTHFQRHDAQDKPFKCPLCPKQFWHRNDLRRHAYSHTGTTPHRCNVCSLDFTRKDHLLDHQQSKICRKKKQRKNTEN